MHKYDPLYRHLVAIGAGERTTILTTGRIESIIGEDLPVSAYRLRQWWANEIGNSRHVQARAWLDAGWEVQNVDLHANSVTFQRIDR